MEVEGSYRVNDYSMKSLTSKAIKKLFKFHGNNISIEKVWHIYLIRRAVKTHTYVTQSAIFEGSRQEAISKKVSQICTCSSAKILYMHQMIAIVYCRPFQTNQKTIKANKSKIVHYVLFPCPTI